MGGRGSGGHNKKSAQVRELEGNPGHRPIQPEAVKLPTARPACPRWLDKEAKAEWRRVCPELVRAGTIALVDRGILAAYCSAFSLFRHCQEVLNEKGLTQEARHGTAPRPEVKMAREARQQIRALAAELGLSPKSRGAKSLAPSRKARDKLDEALNTGRLN